MLSCAVVAGLLFFFFQEKEREKKENARSKHNAMYDMSKIQMQLKKAAAKNTSQNASQDQERKDDAKGMQVEEIKDADLNMNNSINTDQPDSVASVDKTPLSARDLITNKMNILPKSGFKRVTSPQPHSRV